MCNIVAVLVHRLKEAFSRYEALGVILKMPQGNLSFPYPDNVTEDQLKAAFETVFPKGEGKLWSLDPAQKCVLLTLVPPAVHRLEMPRAA